jgi:isopentenyl diphosphate isomerase/L-lactate dehydrogenase-like FMN-dependent dehydrogenase
LTALTLGDYESLARARLDRPVWDFCAGGAGEERTLAANVTAFDDVRLRPTVLRGVSDPDLATDLLGARWAAPLAVAPMAFHTLAHPDGELATVRAAASAGVPVVVSTMAGRQFEELAAVAGSPLWLQVYCFRDRSRTRRLIERGQRAGMTALVLTVDTPRIGRRLRDVRNGFRLPAGVTPANLDADGFSSPATHAGTEFDPALDWSVVDWLRSISPLPVLVKGILTAADAARAVEAGVDGVVVSNHGGRQLDGVPATFDALPEIVTAVAGRCPVLVDGGIRRGQDVLACLAVGAAAVLVGRPILHGLAVGGQDGAARVLGILIEELADAMTLTGTSSLADIQPGIIGR